VNLNCLLVLTGTPVQNNLVELWGLLHWLYPQIFTPASERLFQDSFDLTRGCIPSPFLKSAQDLLATIMLRRTKANVEMSVPPRERLTVFIPMTEAQRFWTYRLLTRMDIWIWNKSLQRSYRIHQRTWGEGKSCLIWRIRSSSAKVASRTVSVSTFTIL